MLNSTHPANTHRILVAIDSQVDHHQHLLAGVIPGVEAIVLSASQDGVEQLTQALRSRPHIQQLHLIAHGKPGWLQLGNSHLSLDTLSQYAPQLQTWFSRSDVQLLLYGCQVAAGDAGGEFVEKLSRVTGASIAASTTLTGSAALGGNWDLEVRTGEGEIAIALNPEIRATYASVLIVVTAADSFPMVGDPPILANQLFSVSTPERFIMGAPTEPIRGILFNDSSTSGTLTNQVLSASLLPGVTASTQGVPITLATDGSFTYNPTNASAMKALPQGATATDTFNYIAIDKDPRTAVGTVTLTVTGVNDAPVATADAFTVSPNAIFSATAATGLRINDTDPDSGETASLTIVSSALSTTNGALVSINGDGSFSYDPTNSAAIKALPQGATLTDTFTYTLKDVNGATSVGSVTMTVNGINDPVIANNDTTATQTNKAVEIAVLSNDIDPDGNPINIFPLLVNQSTSKGGNITTGSSISTIVYTPPLNFTGTDTFNYTVTDGNSTSTATVTINVTPAPPPNRPPVVGNDTLTINQGSTVKVDFLANDSDPDGDTFSLASFTNPTKGKVTIEGNQFVYTAPTGFVGNDGFQYTLIDSKGASSTGGVFFAVVQSGAPSPSPSPGPSPTPTPTPTEECTIAIASPVAPAPNAAADTLTGTASDNLLIGNNNNNTIVSLDGDDLSVGLAGSDNLSGNLGADLLFGNQGNDLIEAGDGSDTLYGGKENDFLNGGLGADTLYADFGEDQVLGGDGNDFIEGGQGGDLIDGGVGDDTIDGGTENDAVKGGDGADIISGGAGSDALQGNAGDDALIGKADADVLDGCGGNDNLTGGDGNDTLYGGSGNDVLDGGLGDDLISGGAGADRITLAATNGVDTIVNFTLSEDKLVLTGGLTVEQVSIIPQNNSTALGLASRPGTVLAVLQGVSSSTITASIFTVG